MAGNFLADTLASLPPETASDDTGTETANADDLDPVEPGNDDDETAEGDDPEAEGDPDEGSEEGLEAEPEIDDSLLDPEKEYTVGENKLKGTEIADGVMMRADYTRKTQELADERKEFEARAAELEDFKESAESWFEAVADPSGANMLDELEVNFPNVAKALRERIINEELELVDMTEQAAALYRKNAAREAADRVNARRSGVQEKITKKREIALKTVELRKRFSLWTDEVLKEVGLDPKDPDHAELVRTSVMKHKDVVWTKDTFLAEAKRIARIAKVEPPKQETPPKDAKGKFVAKKDAPPPVKSTGARAKPDASKERTKPRVVNSGDFFAKLREAR